MEWIIFAISTVVIILAGSRLTKYGDFLSGYFSLGKVWVGIILLGFVTSLPEAVSSLTAVISLDAPDLSVGNILGSNNYNLMLIVMMDFLFRKESVTNTLTVSPSHILSSGSSVFLMLIVFAEMFLAQKGYVMPLGPLSVGSVLIILFYIGSMRALYSLGTLGAEKPENTSRAGTGDIKKVFLKTGLSAAAVVCAAIWLTASADVIAAKTGLGQTFVGSFFVGLVTSLPEIVVTLAAFRLKSLDLAFGNIFGSNMMNIFILAVCDGFYHKGVLLASVSPLHMSIVSLAIGISCVAVGGMLYKRKLKIFGLGIDSFLMLGLFILGSIQIYQSAAR